MKCKNGHTSDEPDYCSVCGVAMGGTALALGVAFLFAGRPRAARAARLVHWVWPACLAVLGVVLLLYSEL